MKDAETITREKQERKGNEKECKRVEITQMKTEIGGR